MWAPQPAIIEHLPGLSAGDVDTFLTKARERWTKSVPAMTALRATLLELLADHGRVMEARQLAEALLAARGSELDDTSTRLALAQACVRTAVATEENLANPRLARRRNDTRVVIASVAEDDPTAPVEEELLEYAVVLGNRADELVDLSGSAPLPGLSVVRDALAAVPRPPGMLPLSDTDMISLAAAASRNTAVTARLELYPRDLDPKKALELAQVTGYLGEPGIEPAKLRDRVLARFPELEGLPAPDELRTLLGSMVGRDIEVKQDDQGVVRYLLPGGTLTSGWNSPRSPGTGPSSGAQGDVVSQRLGTAQERGGFLAVKTYLWQAGRVREKLLSLPGVVGVDVTEMFVRTLREVVAERGKPRWETVVAADTADASPAARTGFGRLVDEAWERLDGHIRSAEGIVLLHDATPLARYPGGMDLLTRLASAARQSGVRPHGLWLLCPMDAPRSPALLDAETVSVLGENEQLAMPRGFADDNTIGRVS